MVAGKLSLSHTQPLQYCTSTHAAYRIDLSPSSYSNCLLEHVSLAELEHISLLRIFIADPPHYSSLPFSSWWSPESSPPSTCNSSSTNPHPRRLYLGSFQEKGFVALSPQAFSKLNVTSKEIHLSTDASCLGNPYQRWVVRNIVGYDAVVINWSMHLGRLLETRLNRSSLPNVGFLRNTRSNFIFELRTGHHMGFNDLKNLYKVLAFIAHRLGLLSTTLLLFFLSTTMVSFILRETQARMLKFTFILHYRIRNTVPYWDLVTAHVVETFIFIPIIIGIMFFLNEFYSGDRLLGFLTLTVVWMAEVYSVIW